MILPRIDVMAWLEAHVPLTLLCDLLPESGPDSRGVLTAEPAPLDPVWSDAARQALHGILAGRPA